MDKINENQKKDFIVSTIELAPWAEKAFQMVSPVRLKVEIRPNMHQAHAVFFSDLEKCSPSIYPSGMQMRFILRSNSQKWDTTALKKADLLDLDVLTEEDSIERILTQKLKFKEAHLEYRKHWEMPLAGNRSQIIKYLESDKATAEANWVTAMMSAGLYLRLGDYKSSLELAQKALQHRPNHVVSKILCLRIGLTVKQNTPRLQQLQESLLSGYAALNEEVRFLCFVYRYSTDPNGIKNAGSAAIPSVSPSQVQNYTVVLQSISRNLEKLIETLNKDSVKLDDTAVAFANDFLLFCSKNEQHSEALSLATALHPRSSNSISYKIAVNAATAALRMNKVSEGKHWLSIARTDYGEDFAKLQKISEIIAA